MALLYTCFFVSGAFSNLAQRMSYPYKIYKPSLISQKTKLEVKSETLVFNCINKFDYHKRRIKNMICEFEAIYQIFNGSEEVESVKAAFMTQDLRSGSVYVGGKKIDRSLNKTEEKEFQDIVKKIQKKSKLANEKPNHRIRRSRNHFYELSKLTNSRGFDLSVEPGQKKTVTVNGMIAPRCDFYTIIQKSFWRSLFKTSTFVFS